jgi:hypothetical protein
VTQAPAKSTSIGETTRPDGDKRFVFRYGVRVQSNDGTWKIASNDEGKQIAFRDFDPAFFFAEGLVKNGEAQVAEVFTQRLYVLID